MKPEYYDLVVLGGGPAGISAAAAAGLIGKKVALVEMARMLGGAGINTGTIPSKTLRETALLLSGWRSRRLLGVNLSLQSKATIGNFTGHARNVAAGERARSEVRLESREVSRFRGRASFVDPHIVHIVGQTGESWVSARKFLIATGSSPWRPPLFPFGDDRVHDSDEILALSTIPRKLAVVGGGVIGSEYACTFAALGVEVHLIDGRDSLMPFLDPEISDGLTRAMASNNIVFHWREQVAECDASKPGDVRLTLTSGAELSSDAVLICAGRQGNTAGLGLEAAGIEPNPRGLIPVDEHYRSVAEHIYAAGDVIGPPALAATGIEQARIAVSHAFGSTLKSDLATILPTGVYTIPEAAMAGETEAAAIEKGIEIIVGRARYADLPRGQIIGDRTGFLKLIFRREDMKLLGLHILGEQATELVHVGLVALLAGAGAELFNRACFNYPTLGDVYKYATYDALMKRDALAAAFGSSPALYPALHSGA